MNLLLVIGKDSDGHLIGNMRYEGYAICATGDSVKEIYQKAFTEITDLSGLSPSKEKSFTLSVAYELNAYFDHFKVLNASRLADLAGLKPTMLREFITGVKQPDNDQTRKLQAAVHALADELKTTPIHVGL